MVGANAEEPAKNAEGAEKGAEERAEKNAENRAKISRKISILYKNGYSSFFFYNSIYDIYWIMFSCG